MSKSCEGCIHKDKGVKEDPCEACIMELAKKFRFWVGVTPDLAKRQSDKEKHDN